MLAYPEPVPLCRTGPAVACPVATPRALLQAPHSKTLCSRAAGCPVERGESGALSSPATHNKGAGGTGWTVSARFVSSTAGATAVALVLLIALAGCTRRTTRVRPAEARTATPTQAKAAAEAASVGRGREYIDMYEGKLVDARGVKAGHVRLYSNGNTDDDVNRYTEVEVYGLPAE